MSRSVAQSRKNKFFGVCLLSMSLATFTHAAFLQQHFVHSVLAVVALSFALLAALLGPKALKVSHRNRAFAGVIATSFVTGAYVLGGFGVPFVGIAVAVYLFSESRRARPARRTPKK